MWKTKASSKIVQKRIQEKSYDLHRQKLKSMAPKLRIEQPIQPDFVYTKNKLKMSRKDRNLEIDKQNEILLSKMQAIKQSEYKKNKLGPEAQNLRTLNATTMNKINERIAWENQRFCEKLMKTKSFYPTNNILDETEHLEYVSNNISSNARRSQSQRNLHSARPKSSYTTFSRVSGVSGALGRKNEDMKDHQFLSKIEVRSSNGVNPERPDTAPMFTRFRRSGVPTRSTKRLQDFVQESEGIQTL